MSDVLIDVSWRGLEVGRQVPLREVTDDRGRIDVALPMPVGSAVSVRAGGIEIAAIVARVHEQRSSGGETAGMVVVPTLDGAARDWWSARAAESAAAVPSSPAAEPDNEPAVMIVAPADPTARPTMVFQAVTPAQMAAAVAAATPTPAQPAAPAAEVAARPARLGGADTDGAAAIAQQPTAAIAQQPTAVIAAQDLRAARAAAIDDAAELAGAAQASAATTPPATTPARDTTPPPGHVVDDQPEDTSRTSVMSAVDIEAIMADASASSADGPSADDSGVVEAVGTGDSGSTDASKRKSGPRGKRRKGR